MLSKGPMCIPIRRVILQASNSRISSVSSATCVLPFIFSSPNDLLFTCTRPSPPSSTRTHLPESVGGIFPAARGPCAPLAASRAQQPLVATTEAKRKHLACCFSKRLVHRVSQSPSALPVSNSLAALWSPAAATTISLSLED